MAQTLNLLVVTMTGTAEMIAEDVRDALAQGFDVNLQLAENVDLSFIDTETPLLVISSTYGQGDVPDPGKPLFQALQRAAPDLSALRYGVISLGDSMYANTFAQGGRRWDEALRMRGAVSLRDALLLDASGAHDMAVLAVGWAKEWATVLEHESPQVRV